MALDNTDRIDRLEQQLRALDKTDVLQGERLDAVRSKADDAQAAAEENREKVGELDKRFSTELAVLRDQVAELKKANELAASRWWQIGIGILVGVVVGLIVGITLAGLGLKK